tara:strand:- start:238 stop:885 length:648 start_codon:yes stop_codon:yes gene_type:complete
MISIEGNIGSGKSTLINKLLENKEDLEYTLKRKVVLIQEPVNSWKQIVDTESGKDIIELFYSDQKKYAFSLQILAYITRLRSVLESRKENPEAILICERCVYSDQKIFAKMLYSEGKISEIEWKIYMFWFDSFAEECKPEKVIYVNTEPNQCLERISKRNREGEDLIPLEYLKNCNRMHIDWLSEIKGEGEEVIELDGSQSPQKIYLEFINKLRV